MLNKIANFIEREHLLKPGGRVIVAVSGGADSVCLLLVLRQLGYQVEAVHCNFQLRGEESLRDEEFVKSLCEKLGVNIHLIHFDTVVYAELHQVGIEMAARELRYNYFEQLRRDIGADEICVAHHQDDSAETVMMNLLRGTGLRGLTGIHPRQGHLVRPLLCVSRKEIEVWLAEQGQGYMIDSTNLSPFTTRNLIRLEVFPRIIQKWPSATENILKSARRVQEALRVYEESMKSAISRLVIDDSIAISELLREPSPESLLFEWLSPAGFLPVQIEQLAASLPDVASGRMWISATHELYVHQGKLHRAPVEACRPTLRLPETGTYVYDETTHFRVRLADKWTFDASEQSAVLDASKCRFPLTVRPIQSADRFQPLGMTGTKLVSDYLTDRHLSIREKRRQLVMTDATGQIIWLVGHRIDHRQRITPLTRQALVVELSLRCNYSVPEHCCLGGSERDSPKQYTFR